MSQNHPFPYYYYLYYSGPSSPVEWHNMTVKRSEDGGATFPRAVVIYDGPSSFSSLTTLHGANELGLLFEHSTAVTNDQLTSPAVGALSFVRVPMDFKGEMFTTKDNRFTVLL